MVAGLGFEPRQTESESVVLPLHNPASTECIISPKKEFVNSIFSNFAHKKLFYVNI